MPNTITPIIVIPDQLVKGGAQPSSTVNKRIKTASQPISVPGHSTEAIDQLVITTSNQLTELVRAAVRLELADYTPPQPAPALPEYLTRKQTARILQVSLNTLNIWAKDTDERNALLVPQKVATRVRYKREDVLLALKTNRRFQHAG